jgi:ElaB/YqjD/DUF883 family membrane-anchored ribosome-binding protein
MIDESTRFGAGVETLKPAGSPAEEQAAQVEALRAELETLKASAASITATERGLASTSANTMAAEAEEYLKRNVFASVGIAAFIGYLWGRTR